MMRYTSKERLPRLSITPQNHLPMSNSTPTSITHSKQRVVEMKRKAFHASSDALFLVRMFARMCQQSHISGTDLHATALHAC